MGPRKVHSNIGITDGRVSLGGSAHSIIASSAWTIIGHPTPASGAPPPPPRAHQGTNLVPVATGSYRVATLTVFQALRTISAIDCDCETQKYFLRCRWN